MPRLGADLSRRDAEHQKTSATPRSGRAANAGERAERLERGSEQRERDQILDDAFRVFADGIDGRTTVDGQRC